MLNHQGPVSLSCSFMPFLQRQLLFVRCWCVPTPRSPKQPALYSNPRKPEPGTRKNKPYNRNPQYGTRNPRQQAARLKTSHLPPLLGIKRERVAGEFPCSRACSPTRLSDNPRSCMGLTCKHSLGSCVPSPRASALESETRSEGKIAFPAVLFTEGRGVGVCWEHLKPKGPEGR
jgi:hypothetical protein